MSISAMKYALDVLDNYVEDPRCEAHCATAIHFLRQAIAEAEKPWVKTYCGGKPNYTTPEQEPVAWREVVGKFTHYYDYNEDGRGEPLYLHREWVGLTDEEYTTIFRASENLLGFCHAVESKLKEKNT